MGYLAEFEKFLEAGPTNPQKEFDKILIIDGMNLFLRHYQANPAMNDNGYHIGGVLGFYRELDRHVGYYMPSKIIVAFEGPGGSLRRRKLYPDYKKGRTNSSKYNRYDGIKGAMDEEAAALLELNTILKSLKYLPVYVAAVENIEADDTISHIVNTEDKDSIKIIISSDKDFLQLVSDKVWVYNSYKKMLLSEKNVYQEYGYTPHNYLTLRCFTGDTSDNIKGVLKVGPKTLNKYFKLDSDVDITVEDILEECSKHPEAKIKLFNTILEQKQTLDLNYKLMQLKHTDISYDAVSTLRRIMEEKPTFNNLKFQRALFELGINEQYLSLLSWSNGRK